MADLRVTYQSKQDTALDVDREFYKRLTIETQKWGALDQFIVPPRSGKGWTVHAGQICRIVLVEGPQVADFNYWNLNNPRERFWASRTKQLHSAHLTT